MFNILYIKEFTRQEWHSFSSPPFSTYPLLLSVFIYLFIYFLSTLKTPLLSTQLLHLHIPYSKYPDSIFLPFPLLDITPTYYIHSSLPTYLSLSFRPNLYPLLSLHQSFLSPFFLLFRSYAYPILSSLTQVLFLPLPSSSSVPLTIPFSFSQRYISFPLSLPLHSSSSVPLTIKFSLHTCTILSSSSPILSLFLAILSLPFTFLLQMHYLPLPLPLLLSLSLHSPSHTLTCPLHTYTFPIRFSTHSTATFPEAAGNWCHYPPLC